MLQKQKKNMAEKDYFAEHLLDKNIIVLVLRLRYYNLKNDFLCKELQKLYLMKLHLTLIFQNNPQKCHQL